MSKLLYPNKTSPKGWRVLDKILQEQKYFPISVYGDLNKAEKEADLFIEKLKLRRHARSLRMDLDQNKIFKPSGEVIGFQLSKRKQAESFIPTAVIQITVDGKQISTSRNLVNRTFYDAFMGIKNWIYKSKNISSTPELDKKFDEAYKYYKSIADLHINSIRNLSNQLGFVS